MSHWKCDRRGTLAKTNERERKIGVATKIFKGKLWETKLKEKGGLRTRDQVRESVVHGEGVRHPTALVRKNDYLRVDHAKMKYGLNSNFDYSYKSHVMKRNRR